MNKGACRFDLEDNYQEFIRVHGFDIRDQKQVDLVPTLPAGPAFWIGRLTDDEVQVQIALDRTNA